MKLITTRRGNNSLLAVLALISIAAVIVVKDDNIGSFAFVSISAAEAWTFSLIFGFKSTWRASEISRALLYLSTAYALLATHVTLSILTEYRPWWMTDIRQTLYASLSLAMLNIIFAMTREIYRHDAP